jgi:hypothetical protein
MPGLTPGQRCVWWATENTAVDGQQRPGADLAGGTLASSQRPSGDPATMRCAGKGRDGLEVGDFIKLGIWVFFNKQIFLVKFLFFYLIYNENK